MSDTGVDGCMLTSMQRCEMHRQAVTSRSEGRSEASSARGIWLQKRRRRENALCPGIS